MSSYYVSILMASIFTFKSCTFYRHPCMAGWNGQQRSTLYRWFYETSWEDQIVHSVYVYCFNFSVYLSIKDNMQWLVHNSEQYGFYIYALHVQVSVNRVWLLWCSGPGSCCLLWSIYSLEHIDSWAQEPLGQWGQLPP